MGKVSGHWWLRLIVYLWFGVGLERLACLGGKIFKQSMVKRLVETAAWRMTQVLLETNILLLEEILHQLIL